MSFNKFEVMQKSLILGMLLFFGIGLHAKDSVGQTSVLFASKLVTHLQKGGADPVSATNYAFLKKNAQISQFLDDIRTQVINYASDRTNRATYAARLSVVLQRMETVLAEIDRVDGNTEWSIQLRGYIEMLKKLFGISGQDLIRQLQGQIQLLNNQIKKQKKVMVTEGVQAVPIPEKAKIIIDDKDQAIKDLKAKISMLEPDLKIERSKIKKDFEGPAKQQVDRLNIKVIELQNLLKKKDDEVKEAERKVEGFANLSMPEKQRVIIEDKDQAIKDLKAKISMLETDLKIERSKIKKGFEGPAKQQVDRLNIKVIELQNLLQKKDDEVKGAKRKLESFANLTMPEKQRVIIEDKDQVIKDLKAKISMLEADLKIQKSRQIEKGFEGPTKQQVDRLNTRVIELQNLVQKKEEEVKGAKRKLESFANLTMPEKQRVIIEDKDQVSNDLKAKISMLEADLKIQKSRQIEKGFEGPTKQQVDRLNTRVMELQNLLQKKDDEFKEAERKFESFANLTVPEKEKEVIKIKDAKIEELKKKLEKKESETQTGISVGEKDVQTFGQFVDKKLYDDLNDKYNKLLNLKKKDLDKKIQKEIGEVRSSLIKALSVVEMLKGQLDIRNTRLKKLLGDSKDVNINKDAVIKKIENELKKIEKGEAVRAKRIKEIEKMVSEKYRAEIQKFVDEMIAKILKMEK